MKRLLTSIFTFILLFAPPSLAQNSNAIHFDTDNQKLLEVLNDPSNRVSPMFKVPPEIRDMVGFWFLIYAKYSLYQTVIYDQINKKIIYDVVDTSDLFIKGKSAIVIEIEGKKRLQKKLNEYRAALQKLTINPSTRFPKDSVGASVVVRFGKKTPAYWRQALSQLRVQTGQRDRVMQGIDIAERFMPAMEKIFDSYKIPNEITRIPIVESSFIIKAQSKADAVGVWQFLEKSAQEYLTVDSKNKIDERLSPIKSAYAAALMFKRNYRILGDWGLAIIAYNHGPRNLVPIRKKFKGDSIVKLLKNTKDSPLGYASRNYYAEFLAMLHAEKYRDVLYGMNILRPVEEITIIKLKKNASIFDLSSTYNISIHDLKVFNPDIFDIKKILPSGTRVVIPKKMGEKFANSPVPVLNYNGKDTERKPSSSEYEFEIIDFLK